MRRGEGRNVCLCVRETEKFRLTGRPSEAESQPEIQTVLILIVVPLRQGSISLSPRV